MPEPTTPPIGDRRPIASREHAIWQRAAQGLVRMKISPNDISMFGMLAAVGGAACLIATPFNTSFAGRILFACAAACIQMRLLANMLDGMVAIAAGKASTMGELFNEVPDRVSDTVLLVAAGYAVSGDPAHGWAAATMALFVTYLRALGKTVGVPMLFQGPMAKAHRMFTLTAACVFLAVALATWRDFHMHGGNDGPGVMTIILGVIILGTIITAFRRLARIVRALKGTP